MNKKILFAGSLFLFIMAFGLSDTNFLMGAILLGWMALAVKIN